METIDAFEFVDGATGAPATAGVRAGERVVALALALADDPGVEVCFGSDEAKRLAAALLRASRLSRGEPGLGEVA
jgi:hypothetical protein